MTNQHDAAVDVAQSWAVASLTVARKRWPLAAPARLYDEGQQVIAENRVMHDDDRVAATSAPYELLFPGRRP